MGRKNSKKSGKKRDKHFDEHKGVLEVTRSGMGFVIVSGLETDILVRPNDFNTALHGDTVRVQVDPHKTGKRMQGIVVDVLERKQMEFVGKLEMNKGFAFFVAEGNKKIPEEVLEEAARIPDSIPEEEIRKRKDFRDILTFTIDPVDAKDFDDALSIRVLKNGNYEIGVHIADVSHYVLPGTALDETAYQKATSVYLPDRVNPMLPEHISNVLCSLRPKEEKLTFSAVFQMTPKGQVKQYWIGKTIIHSDHRFTYEEVQEIIENEDGLYHDEILLLNSIAQRLRKKRFDAGAINFSSTEVRFKLDEKGKPIGIVVKESKEAHQLIEEFMLLANKHVAENVSKIEVNKKPLPFPYRVHDLPSEEKLLPFMAFARKFGHKFDTSTPEKVAESFNTMLKDVQGKPEQHVLEQLGIRTMAKAIYTSENIGHYGLGFENYCHFTSPIRRYPDILVHRILEDCLNNTIEPDKKLEHKCKHCSERERAAMEAERAGNKYKQVEFLKDHLGEEFDGVVSGVAAFGFWVETIEHKCEGLVSVNSLLDYDEFQLLQSDYCLVGARSGRKFRMGDKVRIKVVAANLTKRQLDYEWVIASSIKEEPDEAKKLRTQSKRPKKKRG